MHHLTRIATAAALALTPAAAHADFVRYTFAGNGSASVYSSNINAFETTYGQASFVYYAPLGDAGDEGIIITPSSQTFFANGFPNSNTGLVGESSRLAASGKTLGFVANGQYNGGSNVENQIAVTACSYSNVTRFLTSTFYLDGSCGEFAITLSAHRYAANYHGIIDQLSAEVVEGTSEGYGLASFSFAAGVPEPSTWALMLAGFGMMGYALRKRATVSYAI